MISEKHAKEYCCEDISLIENYQQAITDQKHIWEIHHKGEILPCGRFSKKDLDKFGLYFNRPANELVYLRHNEHRSLHHIGNKYCLGQIQSEETKMKRSKSMHKLKWWNNGIINVRAEKCPSKKWKNGRIKKTI